MPWVGSSEVHADSKHLFACLRLPLNGETDSVDLLEFMAFITGFLLNAGGSSDSFVLSLGQFSSEIDRELFSQYSAYPFAYASKL